MEFLALLLIVLVVVMLQNWVFQRWGLRSLDYSCTLSTDEATQYDDIELVETITNRKWLPAPWLKSEITTSVGLDFAGAQSVLTDKSRFVPSFFMVRSYQTVKRVWNVHCAARGEMEIQKIVLVSTDLFGNVTLSRPVEVSANVLVLPKPFVLEEVFLSPKNLSGDTIVRKHLLEDPFFFSGVREYTGREPINQIHWNASVKEQELMVYQHDSTSTQTLTVILNMQSQARDFADRPHLLEACIRTSASVIENTWVEQIPVRLMSNGNISKEALKTHQGLISTQSWGKEHILELFRLLAKLKYGFTDPFDEYLYDISASVTSSDIVIVTAYLTQAVCDFAREKQFLGVRVKIFILGRISEQEIPEDCDIYCFRENYNLQTETKEEKIS